MINNELLRKSINEVESSLSKRGYALDQVYYHKLEKQRKACQSNCELLQAELNKKSKEMGQRKASGEDLTDFKKELGNLSKQVKNAEQELKIVRQELTDYLLTIPNIPHERVPEGVSEDDNVELSRYGDPHKFGFPVLDHVALGERHNGLLFSHGAKMSGSRFVVLSGSLARLHRALAQFMLDVHTQEHGYTELNVPVLVNPTSLLGTGQLPKFADDLFFLKDDNYALIPTAEVPVTNMFRDTMASADSLPAKYVCHSLCFRREAGAYGKDTHGMIRMHQFEKVELVQVTPPSEGLHALDELTAHAEKILTKLDLPYRKVILCGGDLGFSAQLTYDLEVWLPAQEKYREISSCSYFGDFQARRTKARSKINGGTHYLETVNGSGLAIGRALIAVMENYQNKDGSITIPDVLKDYMGGVALIEPQQ